MKVALYVTDNNRRAMHLASSMLTGFRRYNIQSEILTIFKGVTADVAIAYGWTHQHIFKAYQAAGGHYIFLDLGYWNRRPKHNSAEGHHRFAIDNWDTARTMLRGCPDDRLRALGVEVIERPHPSGEEILVIGMSAKAAATHGYKFEEWEKRMIGEIKHNFPHWKITYRSKPNKRNPSRETIESALRRTRLAVMHHSNVAVEAMMYDVPIFAIKGVGALMSSGRIAENDLGESRPLVERRQLLADTAYAQWCPSEMRNGAAWDHVRKLID